LGACALERRLIAWWGRKDLKSGILLNLTDGGDGTYNPSPERKLSIIKSNKTRIYSEETKTKISKSNKGRKFSEEIKKRMSDSTKGIPKSKEWKNLISEIGRKYYYITPYGTIDHFSDVVSLLNSPMSKNQLEKCIHNLDVIITKLRYATSKYLTSNYTIDQVLGKTYRQLGFNKVKKSDYLDLENILSKHSV